MHDDYFHRSADVEPDLFQLVINSDGEAVPTYTNDFGPRDFLARAQIDIESDQTDFQTRFSEDYHGDLAPGFSPVALIILAIFILVFVIPFLIRV